MRIEQIAAPDAESWNQNVARAPDGCLYQTTWAADVAQHVRKQKVTYLIARDHDTVVGQLLLLHNAKAQEWLASSPFSSALLPLARTVWGRHTFAYGPVILDRGRYYEVMDGFLTFLTENFSRFDGVLPPMHDLSIDQQILRKRFEAHGFTARRHGSFIVNLEKTLPDLWQSLDKSSRYAVRRGQKQDINVTTAATDHQLQQYFTMLQETCARNRVQCPTRPAFMRAYQTYGRHTKTYMSCHQGVPVSAISVMDFNGIGIQFNVCHSEYGIQNKLYGNDLLEWHIIQELKATGARLYDLAGVTPEPRTDKEKGLYHFKSRWGGTMVQTHFFSKP